MGHSVSECSSHEIPFQNQNDSILRKFFDFEKIKLCAFLGGGFESAVQGLVIECIGFNLYFH